MVAASQLPLLMQIEFQRRKTTITPAINRFIEECYLDKQIVFFDFNGEPIEMKWPMALMKDLRFHFFPANNNDLFIMNPDNDWFIYTGKGKFYETIKREIPPEGEQLNEEPKKLATRKILW